MLYPFFDPVSKNTFLAQAEIDRKRSVNGEKTLTGTIYLSDELIDKIDKRWSIKFGNETYIIDYAKQIDQGNRKILDFDATHEFFDVFTKKQIYEEYNGSHTFKWYLDTLFKDTGYSYNLSIDVDALEKENWGMTNRMSLFADLITTAGLEYEINGKIINIKKEIGSDLSTIVRKGFNLQDLNIESDFSNFITYMEGFGAFKDPEDQSKGRLHVTYKSPLADTYGVLEGEPKIDERFTIEENLLQNIKDTVDNSIAISLDMTLEDLQIVGYDYAMAQPGDTIMVINEVMDFRQKVRIIETTESFSIAGIKVGTDVTCGSLSMTDKQQAADAETSSLIDRIANGKDKIPPSWLTDFIVQNSEALNNARSELKFTEQGIIAVDKNNSNNLVIFNSAGLGISTDGGKKYENAITAQGINATAIVTGVLKAIDIEGVNITGSKIQADEFSAIVDNMVPNPSGGNWIKQGESRLIVNGNSFEFSLYNNSNTNLGSLFMDRSGYIILDGQGHQVGGVTDEVVTSHAIMTPLYDRQGWVLAGFYIGVDTANSGELRIVDKKGLPNSGADPANYTYANVRARGFLQQSTEKAKENIKPIEEAEVYKTKALEIVEETKLYEYQYKDDANKQIGFIAEQSPRGILSEEGNAVDIYKTAAYLWKAVQELQAELKEVKANASTN
ncbi:TPA_asm: hypothetical protein GJA98_14940 [Listeria monocytogenes]|nr:hypothetical protein [Listeria monocytogenes]